MVQAGLLYENNTKKSKSKNMINRDKNGRFTKGTKYSHWKNKKLSNEHKEHIGQGYDKDMCKIKGTTKRCPKCGKKILYEDRFSLIRHMGKEHNPMKDPEIVKKANPAKHFEKVNENFKKGIFPENWNEKSKVGRDRHNNGITEEMQKFKSQGFRVIPLGRARDIEPDFIAIKNNKVFAVEVEFDKPDYDKYTNIKYFDDIYWILKKKSFSRAKPRAASTDRPGGYAKKCIR